MEALLNAWPTQSAQLLLERPASCHAGLRTLPAQGQVAPREACIRKACDHLTRLQLVLERVILDQIAAASESSDSSASKPTIPSASVPIFILTDVMNFLYIHYFNIILTI